MTRITKSYPLLLSLTVGILLPLSGCITSQTTVSDTLPYEAQQRINTAEEFNVSFNFEGHPDGDIITASFPGRGDAEYPINGPLEGKLRQLVRTKFGSIDETSSSRIEVSVQDIETEDQTSMSAYKQKLSMEVRAEVNHDGNSESRTFDRSIEMVPSGETGGFKEEDINGYLMQYVVAVDKFIDSNFDIK